MPPKTTDTGNPTPTPGKTNISSASVDLIGNQTYTGAPIAPAVTVRLNGSIIPMSAYSLSYANNTNIGTATVTITETGNYAGTLRTTFSIVAPPSTPSTPTTPTATPLSAATVSVAAVTYNGSAQTPRPVVKLASKPLTAGTDYTLSYFNNTNAGTAKVTVTGRGGYSGSKTADFTINKASIGTAALSSVSAVTYNGSVHTPKPSVKLGSKTLASGSDYTLSYSNNTNAGTAKVTATGKGNYTGSKTVNFTINKTPITSAAISSIAAQTYTGKAITPNPSVALGNRNLVNNTDYILTYASNASAGESTAKVTVTGKGNYTGSKTVNFSIRYKLNYNLNSGTNAASNPITYKKDNAAITLANPVRVGYTFGGWHSDSAFKTKVTSIAKNSSGNKTLYAKWTPTSYGNISANSATRAANIKTMTARSKNYTNGGIAIVGTSYMSGWDAEITFNNLGFDAGKVYNFAIGGDKPSTMGTDQSYINMIAAKAPHVIIINGANDFAASPTDASKNTKLVNKTYNGQVNLIKNLRKALKAKGVSNPKFILSPSLKTPSRYHKSGVSYTADKGPVTCNLWKRVDSYNAKLKAFASANADTTYFDFQPSSAVDDFHNN